MLAPFDAVKVTVTCTVTWITPPTAPSEPTWNLSYVTLNPTPTQIDLSTLEYAQDPACDATVSEVI